MSLAWDRLMPDTRIPQEVREAVFERAKFLCEYCLSPMMFCPDPPIEKLQLNRIELMNLRRLLRDAGEHPAGECD